MNKTSISIFLLNVAIVARLSAATTPAIIPAPVKMEVHEGVFKLTGATKICTDDAAQPIGEFLAKKLRGASGYPVEVFVGKPSRGDLLITRLDANAELGDEGYELESTSGGTVIRAPKEAGLFYGVQSFLQLLPPEVFSKVKTNGIAWEIPLVHIEDKPRFQWRGMMLDVGRNYFPVSDVKQMIDLMALHKLNVFHWHLTEDQGWRIEIKKYPKLTEVGAWRDSSPPYGSRFGADDQRYGGFYTQEQVKDIVAYASARYITIVPEIEMPGHAVAAIASYPEFGNTDITDYSPKVMSHWGVQPYIFAPKEETFRFLDNVLTEVCELFPSKFIHVGGDEAPKEQWHASPFAQELMKREGLKNEEELQGWFVRHIEKILESKGRRLIGWDDIRQGGLSKSATLMVWHDAEGAKLALSQGNDIVMASFSHTYFDYYQAKPEIELAKGKEYEAIGGYSTLTNVYAYDPAYVAASAAQVKQILGTQCQVWTEYIKDMKKAEYMAFPRASAFAEVAWTPQSTRNFDDFMKRLPVQLRRLDQMGVNYRKLDTN